ncbi:MAG TPA: DUF4399 domain-containing protein [Actinomycetota bacterium]
MPRRLGAVAAGLLMLGACSSGGADFSTRSLSITGPANDAVVGGNVVFLQPTARGIDIVAADGDASGDSGHFHVFIDRDPVAEGEPIPREAGIVHSAAATVPIYGLSVGEHTFTVVFGDGNHTRIGTDEDTIDVTVDGPSIAASASTKKGALTVTVDDLEGATVSDGDDPSPDHFHYFLDTEPAFDGSPVPADDPSIVHSRERSVTFDDVATGDHTVWVVLGNVDHVPFEPPVVAMVTIAI